jgi:ABC-2 type transport system ATP-binding protein
MIEARGLTKQFGERTAVDHLDLTVGARGVVGFLGPNGAGKTTTMRMLTGFLPMSDGTAIVAGHDVFEEPEKVKARVGYLPETPPLYPELTVGEYLRFVAELRGIARSERLVRVGRAMERTGLQGFERRPIAQLSKGYRQRVGLAQALVHDPPVLILDEPTSGLDPAQVVGVRALVRELATERAVVLSTHVLAEVDAICSRVVIVHQGRVAGDGTVEELGRKLGRGPWVEFAFRSDATAAEADLSVLTEVTEIARLREGPEHSFCLRGGPDLPAALVRLSAARGWHVRSIAPRPASLEEVFLHLVGTESSS